MASARKVVLSGIIVVILLAVVAVWSNPVVHPHTSTAHAAASKKLPYSAVANGPYSVKGNTIVDANGQPYLIHGIARDGLEYNCSGEGTLDQQHLAYLGSGVNTTTGTYWSANTVRLPLSEGFWLNGAPGYPCSAAQYQNTVRGVVDILTSLKLNVVLDLQWTDAGGQSRQGGGPWAMPDADSVTFWQQVAPIYKGYPNVLFEAYNEPHPATWACWTSACTMTNDSGYSDDCHCTNTFTYASVGMQQLVNTIRATGANNLILTGGMNWGYDLSQLATYQLTGSNIVYDTHPYPYTDKLPNTWDNAFGIPSQTYPVISAESGEYDCDSTYMAQLLAYFDAHQIGWVAFSWATTGDTCTYPLLITNYNGTPTAGYGLFIYQHLHRYAPTVTPVSGVWYFAEGRVGASFTEFLSIDNPDPNNNCPVTIQYIPETGSIITKSAIVLHSSRLTESVNNDVGVPATNATSVAFSAIVSVNPSPCSGVVVERPQYFSWRGINSGSDVVGATHLGQTFYFADVATNNGYLSYLTALNPPTNGSATVTATYYANGQQLGASQSINLNAGQRGTLLPGNAGLPAHVAAMITSTQPIVVERPDYFNNVAAGNAGTVSGSTSVVGTQALSHDWLFAEGYTGKGFQEYLAIANLDSTANAPANVTITLQLGDGSTKVFALVVNALSQTIWDVNANIPATTVSAEITSTHAAIVVQREMFFRYSHTIYTSNGFSMAASGGSDSIGQIGPANVNSYTYAEGYANVGYNEWLTLQNPTNKDETIIVTLINGYGYSYTTSKILVKAHTRSTVDIAALVRQYLLAMGKDPRYSCSISMTAQSTFGSPFVSERPMYWNTGTNGTQGGSAVSGYAGA